MKKVILTLFLCMSVMFTLMAPPTSVLPIMKSEPITFYDPGYFSRLLDAIYKHESNCNPLAYNSRENAVGGLQIRQCRIDHYNMLNGTNYALVECFNYELSKKVFLYFTCHDSSGRPIPKKSWEQAAKDWNGSGPATEIYWNSVKQLI